MMIHRIDKQVLAGAGTLRGVVSAQDITGIYIVKTIAPAATDYLTVNLKSSMGGTEILVNRVNCLALAGIWDIERGFSHVLHADQQAETGGVTLGMYAFGVDLGCLRNQATDSVLEIILEIAGACTVEMGVYLEAVKADRMLRYIASSVLSTSFKRALAVYAYSSGQWAADFATRDVNFTVRTGGQAVQADLMGIVGAGACLGAIEAMPPTQVARVYKCPEGEVEGTCEVAVSGADTSTFQLVGVEVSEDVNRVSISNIQAIEKRISQLSQMDASTRAAVERAGITPALSTLRSILPRMNPGSGGGVTAGGVGTGGGPTSSTL